MLAEHLGLDGRGRHIAVGCGPGSVTFPIAHLFEEAVGLDPDPGMVEEATRRAAGLGVTNTRWVCARAEDLPMGLGTFRVATFAQSFHWMERDKVAAIIIEMLEPGGAFALVFDTQHGVAGATDALPYPSAPRDAIRELVAQYLGPVRRAGQGYLPQGTPGDEDTILRRAGFEPPERFRAEDGHVAIRSMDEVVASVFAMSYSAPHLYGDRVSAFESDLRALLLRTSPEGLFGERAGDTEVVTWRKPS
jgi:SAM-dependent methyltransferase